MSTLDVPCSGRATFHRLDAEGLRDMLLLDERSTQRYLGDLEAVKRRAAIETFLRPMSYLDRPLGGV